jgi:hypothetical protein
MPNDKHLKEILKYVICEDVRTEIGGKYMLIGIYPDDSILISRFPHVLTFVVWTVVRATKAGQQTPRFRVIDPVSSKIFQDGILTINVRDVTNVTVSVLRFSFQIDKAADFDIQVCYSDQEIYSFGKVHVKTPP